MNIKKNYHTAIQIVLILFFVFTNLLPTKADNKNPVKIGFSSIELKSCINSEHPYHYPIEAKCIYMNGGNEILLLFSLDYGEVYVEFNIDVQEKVDKPLNIKPNNILFHTTHAHSRHSVHNTGGSEIDRPQLINLLIQAAWDAIQKAKPAKVKVGSENVGDMLSVHRRGNTQSELGVQTFWFGHEYAKGSNRAEASALINEMSSRGKGDLGNYKTVDKKVYFDGEVIPLVQAIFFTDIKDKPLGRIISFSAHPHMASIFRKYMYDPDYPGYARRLMEKELGGECIFLQGTCGNISPKEKLKYELWDNYKYENRYMGLLSEFHAMDEKQFHSENVCIGGEYCQRVLRALKREKFAQIKNFNFTMKPMNIPMNSPLPKSTEEIEIIHKALTAESSAFINANGDLKELHRLANAIN